MENKTFAVIDTETNWNNEVMSIGVVIADDTFKILKRLYYILIPEVNVGGMFEMVLEYKDVEITLKSNRDTCMNHLIDELKTLNVKDIFAYNASFDCNHLTELEHYLWHDIVSFAAYKQYNKFIPECAKCYKTGRMISGYGVEPIYRMLSNNTRYLEVHNALCDAVDELKIMEMLKYYFLEYPLLNK